MTSGLDRRRSARSSRGGAAARQQRLGRAPRRTGTRRRARSRCPRSTWKRKKTMPGRIRAHDLDDPADRRQRVLGDDLGVRVARRAAALRASRPAGRGRRRRSRSGSGHAERLSSQHGRNRLQDGRDGAPLTGRDSTRGRPGAIAARPSGARPRPRCSRLTDALSRAGRRCQRPSSKTITASAMPAATSVMSRRDSNGDRWDRGRAPRS